MPAGKRFKDIYFGEEGIVTKQLPKVAGGVLSAPGRAATAAVGLAAPAATSPMAFNEFKKVGLSNTQAAVETAKHVSNEQKHNVSDALAGDIVRRPVNAIARSNRLTKMQKYGGISAMKAMEFGVQAGGTLAAAKGAQVGAEALRTLNIKNSPMPEVIFKNEQKHFVDQVLGHPEGKAMGLYHPEKQKAVDAVVKAMDKSKDAPLNQLSATVKSNTPKKYLDDPAIGQAIDNWLGQVDNIVEMTKTLPKSQQTYQSYAFMSQLIRKNGVSQQGAGPLGKMIKNLLK